MDETVSKEGTKTDFFFEKVGKLFDIHKNMNFKK